MLKRNVLNSPRLTELKRKKRKIFLRKVIIILVGFLIIIITLAYISRINRLNISAVEVVGNKIIDTEVIKTSVERQIASKYVWLFPKTNVFFYPKNKIKNELSNQFKRIKDITLGIKDRQTLEVSLTERTGKYIWCGEVLNLEVQPSIEQCYFLDESGYIFDEAPYFSGEVYFKFYGEAILNDGNPSGSYFFKEYFNNLILFKETLQSLGLKPVVLYAENSGDVRIFLSKEKISPMGPEIIFKKDADVENLAENLRAALDTEPLKSKFKNEYSSLEYLDLRFGNKVYYKFK